MAIAFVEFNNSHFQLSAFYHTPSRWLQDPSLAHGPEEWQRTPVPAKLELGELESPLLGAESLGALSIRCTEVV